MIGELWRTCTRIRYSIGSLGLVAGGVGISPEPTLREELTSYYRANRIHDFVQCSDHHQRKRSCASSRLPTHATQELNTPRMNSHLTIGSRRNGLSRLQGCDQLTVTHVPEKELTSGKRLVSAPVVAEIMFTSHRTRHGFDLPLWSWSSTEVLELSTHFGH